MQYPGRKTVKEKREQAVAVTVLEVICSSQNCTDGPSITARKEAGKDASLTVQAQGQAPRKRQRTMQDFAIAAAAKMQQQQVNKAQAVQDAKVADQNAAAPVSQPGVSDEGPVDLEALISRGARHYLLTMRPQVWEEWLPFALTGTRKMPGRNTFNVDCTERCALI